MRYHFSVLCFLLEKHKRRWPIIISVIRKWNRWNDQSNSLICIYRMNMEWSRRIRRLYRKEMVWMYWKATPHQILHWVYHSWTFFLSMWNRWEVVNFSAFFHSCVLFAFLATGKKGRPHRCAHPSFSQQSHEIFAVFVVGMPVWASDRVSICVCVWVLVCSPAYNSNGLK